MNPLDRAIEYVGGTAALARLLGVRKNVVSNWKKRGVPVPYQPSIERVSNGTVRCEDFESPIKIDWQYIRGTSKEFGPR